MARHIGNLIAERLPDLAESLSADWNRVFRGGINFLTPKKELKEFTSRLTAMSKDLTPWVAEFGPALAPLVRVAIRAMRSERGRQRLFRWAMAQPALVLGIDDRTPSVAYFNLLEAVCPSASLALGPRQDATLAAVVRRRIRDALEAEGEARWSLLRAAAPDLFGRYEDLTRTLVRAESARHGFSILEGKRPSFGNQVQALIKHPPPHVAAGLHPKAHKIRNAFLHPHGAKFDPDTGRVDLCDENWNWSGTADDVLSIFKAMAQAVDDFENADLASFIRLMLSSAYEAYDFEMVVTVGQSADSALPESMASKLSNVIRTQTEAALARFPP